MTADTVHVAAHSKTPSMHRMIVAATIGNVLEWFDFVVYGFFAVTIAEVFFPAGNSTASLLITQITRSTTASESGGRAGLERMGALDSLWGGGGGTGGGPLGLADDARGIHEGAAHPLTARARSMAGSRRTRRLT